MSTTIRWGVCAALAAPVLAACTTSSTVYPKAEPRPAAAVTEPTPSPASARTVSSEAPSSSPAGASIPKTLPAAWADAASERKGGPDLENAINFAANDAPLPSFASDADPVLHFRVTPPGRESKSLELKLPSPPAVGAPVAVGGGPAFARSAASETDGDAARRRIVEALDRLNPLVTVRQDRHGSAAILPSDDLFEPGGVVLRAESQDRLNRVADVLRTLDDETVVVRAYTDSLGSPSANRAIAQRRADAVRDYLLLRGVPADRVRAEGIGPEHSADDDTTAYGRAHARRIEIQVEPARSTASMGAARRAR